VFCGCCVCCSLAAVAAAANSSKQQQVSGTVSEGGMYADCFVQENGSSFENTAVCTRKNRRAWLDQRLLCCSVSRD